VDAGTREDKDKLPAVVFPSVAKAPHRWVNERLLQKAVVQFLEIALPDDAIFHHSSNEGKRGFKAQREFKESGAKKGWPDIEIIYRGRAIFIELKTATGRMTKEQIAVHNRLMLAGALVATCRSLEGVEAFLVQIIPLKGRVS